MNFVTKLNVLKQIISFKPPNCKNLILNMIHTKGKGILNMLVYGAVLYRMEENMDKLDKKKILYRKEEKVVPKPANIKYDVLIKQACLSSEIKVNELIKALDKAITDTCEKYRTCLGRQIEIIENGTDMNPLDEYWDQLVKYRVEADNLKQDFETYRGMVEYVGQLAFNLALCSGLIGNCDAKDYVCNDFFELEKKAHEQISENKKYESKLLQITMTSITQTKIPRTVM